MGEERRKAPRARISDTRATYESAAGDQVEAFARDIGSGGLFVRVANPLAVGKRIALEIQVQGEPAPWSALGRVVWTRDAADGAERPPGMGVKLIDVDDAVLIAIERVVAAGRAPQALTAREKTIIGVGSPAPASPPMPAVAQAAAGTPAEREASDEQREPSVVVDLVPKRAASPAYEEPDPLYPSEAPSAVARRRRGRWLVVILLLLIVAAAVYALLVGDFDRALRSAESPPVSRPPPVPLQTTQAVTAPPPLPIAVPAPTPSTRKPPIGAPPHPTWRVAPPAAPDSKKPGTEDNPY